jgi:hypothetical protein
MRKFGRGRAASALGASGSSEASTSSAVSVATLSASSRGLVFFGLRGGV